MIKKFRVTKGSNRAVVLLSGQTFVTICEASGNIIFSDRSHTNEVSALLAPGDYVLESDGRVKSIKFSKKGGQDLE